MKSEPGIITSDSGMYFCLSSQLGTQGSVLLSWARSSAAPWEDKEGSYGNLEKEAGDDQLSQMRHGSRQKWQMSLDLSMWKLSIALARIHPYRSLE